MNKISNLRLLLRATLLGTHSQASHFFHPNKIVLRSIMCYYGLGGDLVSSVLIETKTEPNTSDHVPVTALLTLTPKYIELKKNNFPM